MLRLRDQARCAAFAVAVVLLAGASAGEERAEGGDDPVSEAADDGQDPYGDIEEIVVKAKRTSSIDLSPAAFSATIDFDEFVGEQKSVADVIGEQVGVQVRRFGGPGDRAEVSIRGSTGSQVVVEIDGIRMNSLLTGSADISQLCVGLLEDAQIVRGGDAIGSGEGAIGGSIDFRTRRPTATPVNRVRASGGAFGTYEADVLRSQRVGSLEYSVAYCGFHTDGDFTFARPEFEVEGQPPTEAGPPIERINNEQMRQSANVSLGHDTGDVGHLRASNYFTYARRGEPGLDTGSGPLGGQNPFAKSESILNLAQLEWHGEALGVAGDELVARAFHRYEHLDFDAPPVTTIDEPISTSTSVHSAGLNVEDRWDFAIMGGEHSVVALADAKRDALYDEDRTDVGRTTAGGAMRLETSWLRERVKLVPAVRVEWVQDIGERWLPAVGGVITPWPWLEIRGNYQKSFRAPSFDELYLPDKGFIRGNPDLLPESGRNADVGLAFLFDGFGPVTDIRFEAGLFQQDIDDSIVFIPVSPRTIEPNNTGPARVRGYELSLRASITRFVRIVANHTGLQSESETTGLPLPGRAENESLVRLEVGEQRRWKVVGEMQYTDDIPVSASGAILVPSRVVWSGSISVNLAGYSRLGVDRFVDALWLYASLINMSDVAVRDALFFPQPGRSGFVGTEIRF
jgi:outer membrane cobalamin receptor